MFCIFVIQCYSNTIFMYYTVYKTTNLINGKVYIGLHQTTDPYDSYLGSGKLIKKAIKKHGRENFKKEVLNIFTSREDMINMEIKLVNKDFINRSDTYNLNEGGLGIASLSKENFSEAISKMKKTLKDKNLTEVSKKRINTMVKKYGQNIFKEIGKKSSLKQKENYKNGYINPNTNLNDINIYNNKNSIQYTCKREKLEEVCDLHNLPKRVIIKSLTNKGTPLYIYQNPQNKEYVKYKGWYALYSNEDRIDLNLYMEEYRNKKKDRRKQLSKNNCFNDPKNRGKRPPNNYEIYDNEGNLIFSFKENIRLKLAELGLPVNTFIYSYRNNTKIKKEEYKGWYVIKLPPLAQKSNSCK